MCRRREWELTWMNENNSWMDGRASIFWNVFPGPHVGLYIQCLSYYIHLHVDEKQKSEKSQSQARFFPGLHTYTSHRPWYRDISTLLTALKVLNHNLQSWIPIFLNRETCRFLHRKRERAVPAQLESAQTKASELDHWVCSPPIPEAVQNLGWKWKPLLFCEFQAQWTHNWTKKAKSESYFGTVKRLMLEPLSSNVLFNTVHRIGFCGVPIMCVGSGNGLKWV